MVNNQRVKNNIAIFRKWQNDWILFIEQVFKVNLDPEMKDIVKTVQHEKLVSVSSGVSRGKDFLSACIGMCFLYLTPKFNHNGELELNTKVALTAPTGRQISNIMQPEFSRLFRKAKVLPGRLVSNDIRTNYDEWFMTGFKADEYTPDAWTGFHAANTMFIVTEATGISKTIWDAIEGNLIGNSKLLIVFNPRITTGYAADSLRSPRFKKFILNSLNAPNVVAREQIYPGQVDYDWVNDKVKTWCIKIKPDEAVLDGDFEWNGEFYRPENIFRVKVLGKFPTEDADVLIPYSWVEAAFDRYRKLQEEGLLNLKYTHEGLDVAGMGNDRTVICRRNKQIISFEKHHSTGRPDHMKYAGIVANDIKIHKLEAFIDTIGEGAGTYSRLSELGNKNIYSVKGSEGANDQHDITGMYDFYNMRSYLYWAVRDLLNPSNKMNIAIEPDDDFLQESTAIKYTVLSNGKIKVEEKDNIKKKIKVSPDVFDSLALTFYPGKLKSEQMKNLQNVFF